MKHLFSHVFIRKISRIVTKPPTIRQTYGFQPYIILTIPLSAIALGTWQLRRLKWKLGLIDNLNQLSKAKPLDLNKILHNGNLEYLQEYNHVSIRGHFLNKILFYGPKILYNPKTQKNSPTYQSSSLFGNSNQIGFHLIQAFLPEGYKVPILIDRGWVPKSFLVNFLDPNNIPKLPGNGEREITGLLRFNEKGSGSSVSHINIGPSNEFKKEIWSRRDVSAMAKSLGTTEVFLDADFDDNPSSKSLTYPVGGQTIIALRNEHLSYAITWYGLAFFTGLLWYTKYLK